MTLDTPAWTPFEDGSSPSLSDALEGAGRVVALVVAPGADEEGWAPELALRLARGWADEGLRVVLADARAERPTLHTELGLKNLEGLTDALLWGASVQHVARPLPERGFYVVTAGTAVPDGAAPLRSARWRQLCTGFQEAGVSIAVFLAGDEPGAEAVLDTATDVVVLAASHDDVAILVEGAAGKVRAVLGRPGGPRPELATVPAAAKGLSEASDRSHRETAGARSGKEQPASVGGVPAVQHKARRPAPGSRAARPAPRKGWRPRRATVLLLLLALVTIVILARLGVLPGLGSESTPTDAVSTTVPDRPDATAASPAEASPLLAFSLGLAAHRDATVAWGRVDALSGLVPGVLFVLAPADVNGEVFYRVLAGPASDSADAASLAQRVARATGMDPSGWVVRTTPRAFQLGETEDLAAARERAAALRDVDVPAYVLAVDYSDGTTRFRVYAGAYESELEAAYLADVLAERSLSFATLSHRIGRMPE